MTPDPFWDVLTLPNLISSCITGALVGAFVIWPIVRRLDDREPPFEWPMGVVLFVAIGALLLVPFYVAQTITEASIGAQWPRVVARLVLLMAYVGCAALAHGIQRRRYENAVVRAGHLPERAEPSDNEGQRTGGTGEADR